MTERQKFMLRAALIYAMANLDDLNEAFETLDADTISVNDDEGKFIEEDELGEMLMEHQ